ncbi:hypothetical protein RDABS01_016487 [Bienertia sinuspersici]
MSTSDKNAPRRWTREEDELLVKLLVDMNSEGNGKSMVVSKVMHESGFKASNIDSRLSYLKKKFNALLKIKNKGSGFGWDDNLKMVTGDRKLFEEWSKSHKEAKGMFRKPFPLFDDLEEIYAKDRATGLKSAMPADRDDEDLSHNATKNPTEVSSSKQDDDVTSLVSGISKRIVEEGSSKKATKKKKTTKDIQNVQKSVETMMEKMVESSNAQIDKLVGILEGPKNIKVGLREELGRVPGISRENALSLCVKMTEDEIVIFHDLTDDDEKYDFLRMILEIY